METDEQFLSEIQGIQTRIGSACQLSEGLPPLVRQYLRGVPRLISMATATRQADEALWRRVAAQQDVLDALERAYGLGWVRRIFGNRHPAHVAQEALDALAPCIEEAPAPALHCGECLPDEESREGPCGREEALDGN